MSSYYNFLRNTPGCGCCHSCVKMRERFTVDQLAARFTAVAGTFTHHAASGTVRTTSADGKLIANKTGTTGKGRVTCRVMQTASGGKSRVYGAWVDADEHLFCELRHDTVAGTFEFKLFKRVAGVNTQIGFTITDLQALTNQWYDLELCWNGETASAIFSGIAGVTPQQVIIAGAYDGTGNQVGIGAFPTSGTASFDDVVFYTHHDDDAQCPRCGESLDCLSCEDGTVPLTVAVTIQGITNDQCSDCDDYNATFILTFDPGGDPCQWFPGGDYYGGFPDPCGYGLLRFQIYSAGLLEVQLGASAAYQGIWQEEFTPPIDCREYLDELQIDDDFIEFGFGGHPCHLDAATVTVSSHEG